MIYDTTDMPTLDTADGFRLAEFDDGIENDGESGTYDESEFNDYRARAICAAEALTGGRFQSESDESGVYLHRAEDDEEDYEDYEDEDED